MERQERREGGVYFCRVWRVASSKVNKSRRDRDEGDGNRNGNKEIGNHP